MQRAEVGRHVATMSVHVLMLMLMAEEAVFAQGLADQRRLAREPATPLQAGGRADFAALHCFACHTVRGLAEATPDDADGLAAWAEGFAVVGSTLSGYTGPGAVPDEPDIAFVQRVAAAGCRLLVDVSGRKQLSASVPAR